MPPAPVSHPSGSNGELREMVLKSLRFEDQHHIGKANLLISYQLAPHLRLDEPLEPSTDYFSQVKVI